MKLFRESPARDQRGMAAAEMILLSLLVVGLVAGAYLVWDNVIREQSKSVDLSLSNPVGAVYRPDCFAAEGWGAGLPAGVVGGPLMSEELAAGLNVIGDINIASANAGSLWRLNSPLSESKWDADFNGDGDTDDTIFTETDRVAEFVLGRDTDGFETANPSDSPGGLRIVDPDQLGSFIGQRNRPEAVAYNIQDIGGGAHNREISSNSLDLERANILVHQLGGCWGIQLAGITGQAQALTVVTSTTAAPNTPPTTPTPPPSSTTCRPNSSPEAVGYVRDDDPTNAKDSTTRRFEWEAPANWTGNVCGGDNYRYHILRERYRTVNFRSVLDGSITPADWLASHGNSFNTTTARIDRQLEENVTSFEDITGRHNWEATYVAVSVQAERQPGGSGSWLRSPAVTGYSVMVCPRSSTVRLTTIDATPLRDGTADVEWVNNLNMACGGVVPTSTDPDSDSDAEPSTPLEQTALGPSQRAAQVPSSMPNATYNNSCAVSETFGVPVTPALWRHSATRLIIARYDNDAYNITNGTPYLSSAAVPVADTPFASAITPYDLTDVVPLRQIWIVRHPTDTCWKLVQFSSVPILPDATTQISWGTSGAAQRQRWSTLVSSSAPLAVYSAACPIELTSNEVIMIQPITRRNVATFNMQPAHEYGFNADINGGGINPSYLIGSNIPVPSGSGDQFDYLGPGRTWLARHSTQGCWKAVVVP